MKIRPFTRAILALLAAAFIMGCAGARAVTLPPEEPAMHSVEEFSDDERVAGIDDPWEEFNRGMYRFNYYLDKHVLLPVVSGYEFVAPVVVQKGVSNFFGNIGEVRTFYNSILQLKGKKSLTVFGRFVVNTTVGIGGLFDPASSMGLKRQGEDFGQTLGHWGAGSGPYLVLPVLGPSTARSASGFGADAGVRFALVNAVDPFENIGHGNVLLAGITALEGIDMRHREKFRYYDSGYPFEYEMVRFLYYKMGELNVMK
ncbi:MAG: VacJ family lipoprotein [Syntrophales bacterium]|nr:VacJ family lipoprotein [Syntrophales bacterium]